MNRLLLMTIALLITAMIAGACGPTTPAPDVLDPADIQSIHAPLPRLSPVGISDDAVADLVQRSNTFAFDLYRAITGAEDGNLIYSPYSISLAFSMVYPGARGETEAQMAEVMGYLSPEEHHKAFNALDQHFAGLGSETEGGPDDPTGEPFQLNIANAVWGQHGYPFKEDYLEVLAQYYGAGLRTVDFAENPEAARQAVNNWIEEQTQDRIREMVPPGMIDTLTRLVLANAIYFKGSWFYPFPVAATQEGSFTLLDGSQVSVPLMGRTNTFLNYLEGDGFQAALLPYVGDGIQMLVVLPEPGSFEDIESRLSAEFLDRIRQEIARRELHLVMPKLDFESSLDLRELLMGMGMTAPFGEADFSRISDEEDLVISGALHKANISVDERGTEAAAATVIVMPGSAPPEEPVELRLDRPFIFAILEGETGSILFMGRVVNPAE